MIRPALHSVLSFGLVCLAAVVMTFFVAIPAMAGVSLPPMPSTRDTNTMEQYRVKVFYEAQKSEQERLKVGQQRYDKMLSNRAIVIQAMAADLAERQQQVGIPSESASRNSIDNKEPNTLRGTIIGTAIIGLGFLGFRYYLNRQNLKETASQKY
jgi:hypothetical protein